MKKITGLFLIIVFFSSCAKSTIEKLKEPQKQIVENFSTDPLFTDYISDLVLLIEKSPLQTYSLDEKEFLSNYKNAILNSDKKSKKIIASAMGFEFEEVYWKLSDKMNHTLQKLSAKYDFSQFDENQLRNLIKTKMLLQKKIKTYTQISMSIDEGPLCAEKYWNCMDQAAATYVLEQIACVGAASIGWTGIGFLVFVGCEAGSKWHLNSMRKGCDIDFRICNAK